MTRFLWWMGRGGEGTRPEPKHTRPNAALKRALGSGESPFASIGISIDIWIWLPGYPVSSRLPLPAQVRDLYRYAGSRSVVGTSACKRLDFEVVGLDLRLSGIALRIFDELLPFIGLLCLPRPFHKQCALVPRA